MRAGSGDVLVTGASGFIGRALIRRLVGDGCTPVCTARRPAVPAWAEAMRDHAHSSDYARFPEETCLSHDEAPPKSVAMLVYRHETAR
jgi:NAD(P)-dependent dehydrogenase (short-subunit alcohol dehydrogenase family)